MLDAGTCVLRSVFLLSVGLRDQLFGVSVP
eukprot:COSAG02_NODE_26873_length_622_cov_0.755258_3_plen_29_part_01